MNGNMVSEVRPAGLLMLDSRNESLREHREGVAIAGREL